MLTLDEANKKLTEMLFDYIGAYKEIEKLEGIVMDFDNYTILLNDFIEYLSGEI